MCKTILFTSPTPFHPEKGGVGRVTDKLCRFLQSKGYKVLYLHLKWYAEDRKLYSYPAPVTILPNENIYSSENIKFYREYLTNNDVDVIINQDGLYDGSYIFLNTGNLNVKKISVLHNNPIENFEFLWKELSMLKDSSFKEKIKRPLRVLIYPFYKRKIWKLKKQHYEYIFRSTDCLLLLSDTFLPVIEKLNHNLVPKCVTIPNPNTYNKEEIDLSSEKKKEIIYVGRLYNKAKRIDRLLYIWKNIYKNNPEWQLKIIGDGPDRRMLESLSKEIGLKRVDFVGFDNPMQYYKDASILCLTSDYEGWGMALTEAMQYGCVPIAFDSYPSIKDIIVQGKTGVLIKPFNIEEYSKKLELLMNEESYRKTLADNARNYVGRFDISQIGQSWINLIESL